MDERAGAYVELSDLVRLQYEARGFRLLPRQPVRSVLAGRHASRLRGRGLNFEELRRYLPGDDVRTMDWRVTARTRKPHVRVYSEERDRPVILVVDQRLSLFFGTKRVLKSVVAAEVAALASWKCLDGGDRVGGIVFGDEQFVEIAPQRSRAGVMRLLSEVVRANHRLQAEGAGEFAPEALNAALERTSRKAHHDHLIVVVSDFHGANAETRQHLSRLGRHNDVVLAFVYDSAEAELPAAGRVVVGSGELQLVVDTAATALKRRFDADFGQRLERIRELAARYRIPVLPLETSTEVAPQVRKLLGNLEGVRNA